MRGFEDLTRSCVVGIGVGHLLREVDGLHRSVGVEMSLRSGYECVDAGQFHQIGADIDRVDRI